MSLPEVNLVLATHRRTRAEELHATARATFLASAAKWSEEFAADYNELLEEFADHYSTRVPVAPQKVSRRQLGGFFAALGIPTQN
jgi:hypothetical protein